MKRGSLLVILAASYLAACAGDAPESTASTPYRVDCTTVDTGKISMFVRDEFQRDLAIDIPKRVTEHLDETPELICLTLHSDHGELPVIAYATAHRPDAYSIYPLLIVRGANPEDALPIAVYLGKTRSLRWLLENVDPNAGDALIIAAAERRVGIVQQLLAAGADAGRKSRVGPFLSEPGKTALHHAVHHGVPEMIRALIDAGADVNELDAQQRPPLHEAVVQGNAGTIQLLLDAGATPFLLQPEQLEALRGIAKRYRMERLLAQIG